MKVTECPKSDSCSAALCPLDRKHLKIGVWYPDEEVCRKYYYSWIQNQKKIAKKAKDMDKYFTYEMLKRNCKLTMGIVGLDPNKAEESQLKKWFENHPIKKELTKIQKKVIVERFKKYRKEKKK